MKNIMNKIMYSLLFAILGISSVYAQGGEEISVDNIIGNAEEKEEKAVLKTRMANLSRAQNAHHHAKIIEEKEWNPRHGRRFDEDSPSQSQDKLTEEGQKNQSFFSKLKFW